MAWIYHKGKKREVRNAIKNDTLKGTNMLNVILYVDGDKPNHEYRLPALRVKGIKEDDDMKKYNDNVIRAFNIFEHEQRQKVKKKHK